MTKVTLTRRELQVARLLVKGKTQPEIATELGISPRTVEAYSASLRRKTASPTSRKAAASIR